jgi:shikimate dehydrogenase
VIASRKVEQAEILAEAMSKTVPDRVFNFTKLDVDGLLDYWEESRLVINTTPLGMTPNMEFSPYPAGLKFSNQAVFYDLVYNPRETMFVRQARAAGLHAANGLGMLVEQAALGFEIWTGCPAPRTTMFLAVEA